MQNGIAIVGNVVADTIKIIDSYPQPGMLCSILSISRTTGGPVPNMAIDLKLMDAQQDVRAVGLVGDDDAGAFSIKAMSGVGVDVTGVRAIPGAFTSFTDVMTVRTTGERTFFHARGANSLFAPEHIDFDALGGCSIFHMAYALLLDTMDGPDPEYGTVMAKVLAEAKKRGFLTSMDVVSESGDRFANVVTPSLRYCDYLIVNEIESSRVCGITVRDGNGRLIISNMPKILEALMGKGVGRLAVVHAPEGGWCLEHNGKFTFRPSLRLPTGWIKGSVGAGDAFCAGVLYALNRGWAVETALDIGAAAAACILGKQDGYGMKPLAELRRMTAQLPKRNDFPV